MRPIEVGFFSELSYGRDSGGKIRGAIFKISEDNCDRVLAYLKAGVVCVVAPGVSINCLSEDREIIGTLALLTDGKFIWPSDLAFYVERYRVGLPDAFLSHMREHDWRVSTVDLSVLDV